MVILTGHFWQGYTVYNYVKVLCVSETATYTYMYVSKRSQGGGGTQVYK